MTKTILLDTNVIIRRPRVLSLDLPDSEFATTPSVLAQLGRLGPSSGTQRRYHDLLSSAVDAGKVRLLELPPNAELEPIFVKGRFDAADTELLSVAKQLARSGPVLILTDDVELLRAANSAGLEASSSADFLARVPANASVFPKVAKQAEAAIGYSRRHLILSALGGAAVAVIAVLLVKNARYVLDSAPVWGSIGLLILAGLLLFWFRARQRLAYGIFEYLVGVVTTTSVLWPTFDYSRLTPGKGMQLLAGLYVMVRGLDNSVRGMRATRWASWWTARFGE